MIVILSVIIVLLLIYKYAWPKKKYWEALGLPAYKIKMFLSMTNVLHEMGDVYKKMKVEGQRVAGLYLTWEKLLFVTDLHVLPCLVGRSVNVANEFTFDTSANAERLFDVILNSATNLVIKLQELSKSDKEIVFSDLSTLFTTEIMTSLVFGTEFHKLASPSAKIRDMSLRAGALSLRTLVKRFIIEWFPRFAKRFKMSTYDTTAHAYFAKTVQEAVEHRKNDKILRHDFLQSLLDAENVDGEKMQMPTEEIVEHVMSYFVAGVESAAVTIGCILVEIKRNSHVESNLRKEVCAVLEKFNYTFNSEALGEMIYLDALIRETMRMYPPVPIVRRKITESFTIPETEIVVDKDIVLAFSMFAVQRDPDNYDAPNLFNPERFSKNTNATNGNYIFTESPPLLMQQCKICTALLIWNFEFELSEKTKYPLELDAPNGVLTPKDCILLKFLPLITSL